MSTRVGKVKLLPTYNVSNMGRRVFLPIIDVLATTDINLATTTITRSTVPGGRRSIDEQDEIISDISTIPFYNEGTDTEFDQIYRWTPDIATMVNRIRINIGFALNVSAVSAGTFDFTGVRITMQIHPNEDKIFENIYPLDMTGITTVDSAYSILDELYVEPFKIPNNSALDIRIRSSVTTGTGDFQAGILPLFCYNIEAGAKPFTRSGFTLSVTPTLNRADPNFREDPTRIV